MKIIKKSDRTCRIFIVFVVVVSMVLHNSFVPVAYVYAAGADSDTASEESGEESEDDDENGEDEEKGENEEDEESDESDENEDEEENDDEEEDENKEDDADNEENDDEVGEDEGGGDGSEEGVEEGNENADQNDQEETVVSESEDNEYPSIEQSLSEEDEESQTDESSKEKEQSDGAENENNEITKEPGVETITPAEEDCEEAICGDMVITVEQTNDVEIDNNVQSSADTGNNTADQNGINEDDAEGVGEVLAEDNGESDPSSENEGDDTQEQENTNIETGDAFALVNIINTLNTNIYGENWLELVYNIDGVHEEDINLFEKYLTLIENNNADENVGDVTIENTNTAEIVNTVAVDANSGNNSASENDGDVMIDTGDAVAGANIVNNVNNNLVGNNWLFATINVFGLWTGDLIVPGEGLLGGGAPSQFDHVEIENANTAEIQNTVEVDANTGENAASDNEGMSSITTGEGVASVDVVDVVNTNIVADNWFFLLINDLGSWSGNIVHHDQEKGVYQSIFQYTFGEEDQVVFDDDGAQCTNCSNLTIKNTNTATITNTVSAHANTGGNVADENGGDASISTGNAHAWTNIVNFVNNNIIGNNWLFSVVNVLGEWKGDTVFAYPDLSIAIDDGKKEVMSGDKLTFEITYHNEGEATAENVEILVELSGDMYSNDVLAHNVGTLAPGESGKIRVNAIANDVQSYSEAQSIAGVRTSTKERELANNTASDSTNILVAKTVESGDNNLNIVKYDEWEYDPDIEITRSSSSSTNVHFGEVVKHQIIVENTGDGPIYNIVLFDAIENSSGATLEEYGWIIGDLDEDEAVMVEYEIIFNGLLNENHFNFDAVAYGYDVFDDEVDSNKESIAFNIIGNLQRYAYNVVTGNENIFPQLIPEAQAATIEPVKPAQITRNDGMWLWLISLLIYSLIINWTLFPRKVNY
jgi:uncharacterized repeat protein (TIGR01451 family)